MIICEDTFIPVSVVRRASPTREAILILTLGENRGHIPMLGEVVPSTWSGNETWEYLARRPVT